MLIFPGASLPLPWLGKLLAALVLFAVCAAKVVVDTRGPAAAPTPVSDRSRKRRYSFFRHICPQERNERGLALASCKNWFSREAAKPVDSFEPAGTFWDDASLVRKQLQVKGIVSATTFVSTQRKEKSAHCENARADPTCRRGSSRLVRNPVETSMPTDVLSDSSKKGLRQPQIPYRGDLDAFSSTEGMCNCGDYGFIDANFRVSGLAARAGCASDSSGPACN